MENFVISMQRPDIVCKMQTHEKSKDVLNIFSVKSVNEVY